MENPMFRYFDMNNNVFTIDNLKVEYTPLTKETSFTGKYDGGKSAKGKLTKKQMDMIYAKIDTIKDSKSLKVKKRSGQCAMLYMYAQEKKNRILLPESSEQKKIDTILREAVGI